MRYWLLGLVSLCLLAVAVYKAKTSEDLEIHFFPPSIHAIQPKTPIPPNSEVPAPTARAGWLYQHFTDGREAESWLTMKKPNPEDIYAVFFEGVIFVWCKPGNSRNQYRYQYLSWNPKEATSLPLPSTGNHIPIGFGRAGGGRVVFVFFGY